MVAAAKQPNVGWTWGGVVKGVAKVAAVVAVGVGIFYGAAFGAEQLGWVEAGSVESKFAGTAGAIGASIADIPKMLVDGVGSAITTVTDALGITGDSNNINGKAAVDLPFGEAVELDIKALFSDGHTAVSSAFEQAQDKYENWKESITKLGLWDQVKSLNGVANLEALFSGDNPKIDSITGALASTADGVKEQINTIISAFESANKGGAAALAAAENLIKDKLTDPAQIQALLNIQNEFVSTLNQAGTTAETYAGSVSEALGLDQGYNWKTVAGVGGASAVAAGVIGRFTGRESGRRETLTALENSVYRG